MRCRYRENMYKCGEYMEVDIFPTFHKGGKTRRRAKYKPTGAMQERLNQRNAERALTRLLNANFVIGDYEVTLTYSDKYLPSDGEQADKDAINYIRRVKRLRARLDLPEMRYVKIEGGGRWHFHIVMTGGVPREKLEELWGRGYCNVKRLVPNDDGLAGLATYIARQLPLDEFEGFDLFSGYVLNEETGELAESEQVSRKKGKRRWSASKNLIRPEPEVREGKISQARVEELSTVDSANREAFEEIYPGYEFVRCEPYYNGDNGGWYLHVRMRRRREKKGKRE